MAIAFDNSIGQQTNAGTSSLTYTYTTSGTNRYLFVGAIIQSSQTISGITYAGVSMTQITSIPNDGVSANETAYLFGLANPTNGANNVVITGSGNATIASCASSYTGAQQTNSAEASNTATGNSGTATVSVTTITDNDWLVNFFRAQFSGTAGSNTTIRSAASSFNMTDSNGVQTPPGSFSQTVTGGSNSWSMQCMALKASVAVTTNPASYLTLLGVA